MQSFKLLQRAGVAAASAYKSSKEKVAREVRIVREGDGVVGLISM